MTIIRERLDDLSRFRGGVALRAAATRIRLKLRKDATTRRGNIPSFGKFGNVLIAAQSTGTEVHVSAAPWVMRKAEELGQPAEWMDIVAEEVRKQVER